MDGIKIYLNSLRFMIISALNASCFMSKGKVLFLSND